MPNTHALLSASSAERWLNCPGSVSLTKDMPDTSSDYAEEGTLAHNICELKLIKHFKAGLGPKAYSTRLNKLKKNPLYQKEMDGYTDQYVDYIKDLSTSLPSAPFVAIEKKVDFSAFVPQGFGTSDCILIHGSTLYVIDFKYGKGVNVEAENNPQMMLYSVGALLSYQMFYDISTVHMTIVQPRNGGIKTCVATRNELLDWAAFIVKPVAKKAFEGTDELLSGVWCRFCRAGARCRKRAEDVTSAIEDFGGKLPPMLTDLEVGQMLSKIGLLIKYADRVKEYAQSKLLQGGEIPGWKLVEGRGSRAWDSQIAAFEAIKAAGVEEALLYERKPVTAPALEKTLGATLFAKVAGAHVIKQPGKPALAPENDPREAYSPQTTIHDDFKEIENG